MLGNRHAAIQQYGMTLTFPISKRGRRTLPPALCRNLGLDGINSPLVVLAERDGVLFLQAPVPVRTIPCEKLARWISRDETEMSTFTRRGKARSKK